MTFLPCIGIPIYNHKDTIAELVKQIRKYNLECIIVDDGSDDQTRQVLKQISQKEKFVQVHRLAVNEGKGGAVQKALQVATDAGFSHMIQVDADFQHNLDDLEKMLDLSKKNPDSLILGQAVYDESVNKARYYSRYITHFFVWIECLSFKIKDSMCGFRVYPVKQTVELIQKSKPGKRMDFDPEIAVRMFWNQTPIINFETRVQYDPKGISHFHYFKDNVLISWMHTKLVSGMLIRWPYLLYRKFFPANEKGQHWSSMKERGSLAGLKTTLLIYRYFGRYIATLILYPVIIYFFLSGRSARKASQKYLEKIYQIKLQRSIAAQKPTIWSSYYHFLTFGKAVLDKVSTWSGNLKQSDLTWDNKEELLKLVKKKKGAVIIGSHLGNIEILRALSLEVPEIRLNLLVMTEHAQMYNELVKGLNQNAQANLISVQEVFVDTGIALKEKIDAGEMVCIMADRTSLSAGKTNEISFLGEKAAFSQGPWILGWLMECPVYLIFCLRSKKSKYKIYFEFFSKQIDLPRKTRKKNIENILGKYAKRLEHYCLIEPFQWFNFFDFWQKTDEK